jgi:hypothetical protein
MSSLVLAGEPLSLHKRYHRVRAALAAGRFASEYFGGAAGLIFFLSVIPTLFKLAEMRVIFPRKEYLYRVMAAMGKLTGMGA